MFKILTTTAIILVSASSASADIYKIFWPEENLADPENNPNDVSWQQVKITNISSNTVIDGSLSGIYDHDFSDLTNQASVASNNVAYELERGLSATNSGPTVLEFSGSTLKFRAETALAINPQGSAGDAFTYDVVYEVNPVTGELLSQTLVASTEAEAAVADAAGYNVDLEISNLDRSGAAGTFQSYGTNVTNEGSVNIVTKGGLVTEQLSNPDGSSLMRKEDDDTVHIGANSIVLADELVSASGNDEVYSSSGVLQLGNNDDHRTVIRGTLEVSNPTQANHAANKSYVDTGDAATLQTAKTYAEAYSNGIAAMMMASSQITYNTSATGGPSIGIGLGAMDGKNAIAFGFGGVNQNTGATYSASVTYSDFTKQAAFGAGVSWSLN